jgi:enamine deaminase RidA (YjgF/YER057c/UK114 family)
MPIERHIITPRNERLNVSRNFNLPHSPGIHAGDFIFLSGMLSTDPETGERSPRDAPDAHQHAPSARIGRLFARARRQD